MSIRKEYLLLCDGGDKCPLMGPFGFGNMMTQAPVFQRESAAVEGWIKKGNKDYCPDCVKEHFPEMLIK